METTIRRHKENGPLHDLLLEVCPPDKDGFKSITILAKALKMSSWGVHKWVKHGRVPPLRVVQLVDMAPSKATIADFSPFVYV